MRSARISRSAIPSDVRRRSRPLVTLSPLDGEREEERGRTKPTSFMNATTDPIADLRRMSATELEQLGQDSLRDHILAQAVVAHQKHGPLTFARLESFLTDPECVRHPTRLVFEFGEMAMHQFGQPDIDWRDTEHDGRVLYLRPMLRDRPELVRLAVAYLLPLINYGEVVTDELCVRHGAALLGMEPDAFYSRICALADEVGAETRTPRSMSDEPLRPAAPVPLAATGCGGGCG